MGGLSMNQLLLLLNYMKGYRFLYIAAITSVAAATLFTTAAPLVIRVTIDSIIGSQPLEAPEFVQRAIESVGGTDALRQRLWIPGIIIIGLTLLRGLFLFLRGRWAAIAAESIAENVRERLYDHLQHLSYAYHVKAETGDLIQRATSDVELLRRFLGMQFVEAGNAIFMVSVIAFIMFRLHPTMAAVAMAVVPIIFTFAVIFYGRVRSLFQLADEAEAEMQTALQENLTGVRVIKAFARQEFEIEKFEEKNAFHRDLTYRVIRLLAFYWSSSDFLCMAQIGLVLVVGAYFTANEVITLGTLVVFVTYEGMLLWPVRQLGRIITDMGKAVVALTRIQDVLDQPAETMEETGRKPAIQGSVEFSRVTFGYELEHPILHDISFSVKPGETIGILGPTGSGKSSLVHLLARLYDYQSGSVKIDGHELCTIDKGWIRRHVGLVLQEPFLFARTIGTNIRMAKQDASNEEVQSAAKTASVHDVICEFDKGYETPVGERGVSLSGGQRQRVAIARAVIKKYPIVIFDDSLSAVDTETDFAIRTALAEEDNRATTFLISHRIISLAEADLIIVMDKGRIVQRGTHDELIREPGLYKRVWDLQEERDLGVMG